MRSDTNDAGRAAPGSAEAPQRLAPARRAARRACTIGVKAGLPPAWVGWRHVEPESARAHVARLQARGAAGASYETVHPETRAHNPLPLEVPDRDRLPDDAGWWGYSMRDVPDRLSGETFVATIPEARVVSFVDERRRFFPAILTRDGRAIDMREIVFRHGHAATLRAGGAPRQLERATWICERVYDNHSHWLTAHLPKLVLLRDRGALGDVLLPEALTPAMAASIRLMGLDPASFRTFEPGRTLEVGQLTILGTDRFRPELLRPVRDALAPPPAAPPTRRIYVSRAKAGIRRLVNEDAVWPLFEAAGFERVLMEERDFAEQVALMRETKVLAAPHGAGLTNMMACPAGAIVLEMAWLGFPNPNFYALAAAMGHDYALAPAQAHGDAEPLRKDLVADLDAVRAALAAVLRRLGEPAPRPGA